MTSKDKWMEERGKTDTGRAGMQSQGAGWDNSVKHLALFTPSMLAVIEALLKGHVLISSL